MPEIDEKRVMELLAQLAPGKSKGVASSLTERQQAAIKAGFSMYDPLFPYTTASFGNRRPPVIIDGLAFNPPVGIDDLRYRALIQQFGTPAGKAPVQKPLDRIPLTGSSPEPPESIDVNTLNELELALDRGEITPEGKPTGKAQQGTPAPEAVPAPPVPSYVPPPPGETGIAPRDTVPIYVPDEEGKYKVVMWRRGDPLPLGAISPFPPGSSLIDPGVDPNRTDLLDLLLPYKKFASLATPPRPTTPSPSFLDLLIPRR